MHPEQSNLDEQCGSPKDAHPILSFNSLPTPGLIQNSPEMILWAGMFQMLAGSVNAVLQAQPGTVLFPASPTDVSGCPELLPLQKPSARQG